MGWTGTHATFYTSKGKVDAKKECDYLWHSPSENGRFKVLKSTMVGSTYYAAIAICREWPDNVPQTKENLVDVPESERRVFGMVILTTVDSRDYYNFTFKEISETSGPCESKCPVSIIDLLSPTTSKWANEWRERCREYAKYKRSPNNPANLPIGTKIKFTEPNGNECILIKRAPAYQFKTAWWYDAARHAYCSKKRLPDKFEIIP